MITGKWHLIQSSEDEVNGFGKTAWTFFPWP